MSDTLKCKEIISHFANTNKLFEMILKKWKVIEEIVAVLKIPYDATIALQNRDFTLSDFYGHWLAMEIQLKRKVKKAQCITKLPQHLLVALEKRQKQLLDNKTIMTAVYLDPRYRSDIEECPDKEELVKHHIQDIWNKVQSLKNPPTASNEDVVELSDSDSSDDDVHNILDKHYQQKGLNATSLTGNHIDKAETTTNLFKRKVHILDQVEKMKTCVTGRLESSSSVLTFWEMRKNELPELYEVAKIIFCISPTQSTVERYFSVLGIVFSELRYGLNQNLLEDILMISLNPEIFYKVNENDLNELKLKSAEELKLF